MRIDILTSLAKKDKTFTFEEALKISGLPRGSLKKVIYRLEQRGAIERIEKGKYMIIPLGAEKGRYTLNEFVIGSLLVNPYSDDYKAEIIAYSLEEIVAEKTRALFERTRPRDLYDVRYLWNMVNKGEVLELLEEKCRFKNVIINTSSLIDRKRDFNNAWEVSLRHQLKQPPDFNKTFDEVLGIIKEFEGENETR